MPTSDHQPISSSAPWTTTLDGMCPRVNSTSVPGLLLVVGDQLGGRVEVLFDGQPVVVEVALLAGREQPVGGRVEAVAGDVVELLAIDRHRHRATDPPVLQRSRLVEVDEQVAGLDVLVLHGDGELVAELLDRRRRPAVGRRDDVEVARSASASTAISESSMTRNEIESR